MTDPKFETRADRYPIATLADIAAIPDEALPRFLAELPAILKARKEILDAAPAIAAAMKAKAPWPLRLLPVAAFVSVVERGADADSIWVDDDKGTVTVSVAVKNHDEPFYSRTEHLPRHAGPPTPGE